MSNQPSPQRRSALALLLAGGAGVLSRHVAAAAGCVPVAKETAGPFPANGSNGARGAPINALVQAGIVRSDIRSSFGASTTTAQGVPLELELTLVDSRRGCTPLAGRAIHVWQADRDGEYSLYQGQARTENYLRGVQVADAAGRVRFTTIFPPCYGGRYPHIHFEIYAQFSGSAPPARPLLTSQLVLPAEHCAAVYASAAGYGSSRENFSGSRLARDGVFGDNSAAQLAAMTPRLRGDPQSGYRGELSLAI